jgi:ssDNA-binding Zn-finger/Zn-ribbon topoisomerase 1
MARNKRKAEVKEEEEHNKTPRTEPTTTAEDKVEEEPPVDLTTDNNENEEGMESTFDPDDPFGIESMTIEEIQNKLQERNLSTNGDERVLKKRLSDRLTKEQDPKYKPRSKNIRSCAWCGELMKKRNGFRGDFYGCSTFPRCQYTTSLKGDANPSKEHLRGVAYQSMNDCGADIGELIHARREDARIRKELAEDRKVGRMWGVKREDYYD